MEILFAAFIKATGWSIINSLWQGAVIYIALLLLLILNPGLKAKSRHNLSFMALLAMFCWFSATFYTEFDLWFQIARGVEFYHAQGFSLQGEITRLPIHISLFEKAEQSFPLIVLFYTTGLLFQITMLLLGYLRIRQLKTKGLKELPENLQFQFAELSKTVGLRRQVIFNLSSKVSVPMVVGYLKPIVLIPLSLLTHLDAQQLEAVIIHELSHIRRNDYMLNLIKISIETILFFNPFVWICSKLVDSEREHACDDLVLKITGQPLIYASTLLQIERIKTDQNAFTMAITGKKFHLLNRIKRMTEMKTNTLNFKIQLLSILVLSAVVVSLAWIPVKEDISTTKEEEAVTLESKPVQNLPSGRTDLVITQEVSEVSPQSSIVELSDTLKNQFKIMVEDENGEQVVYNNVEEMPEDLRFEFLDKNRKRFAMPVFHFNNGVKGFNGFTMRAGSDSTTKQTISITSTENLNANKSFNSASALTIPGSGKNLNLANDAGSQTLNSTKNAAENTNQTAKSLSGIRPVTKGIPSGRSTIIGSVSEGTPEERAAVVKKILESQENRDKIAKILLRPIYTMNPSGQLEEDLNSVVVFDDITLKTEDIMKVIRPGIQNEYGIYIPTREEKLQKLIENPANKEKLREIITRPESKYNGFSMNGRSIYQFEEALVLKSDILGYLQRNQRAKQSLLKN